MPGALVALLRAGNRALLSASEVLPAGAITLPPQLVEAFAGLATINPVGKVSETVTLVTSWSL